MAGVTAVICGLLVAGCDKATNAAKKMEEGATKAAGQAKEVAKEAARETKEAAKEATDVAKDKILKPIQAALPKIEDKIKGLGAESATKAKEKFEEFKVLLEKFKTAAPDKWEALKEGLMKAFDELKKLVGMDK
jgi:hypothetical protein